MRNNIQNDIDIHLSSLQLLHDKTQDHICGLKDNVLVLRENI